MSGKVRIQCKDCATEMMTDGGDNEGTETLWCPKCHPGFCPKCGREDTPAASLRARPQEPRLSKEWLDELRAEVYRDFLGDDDTCHDVDEALRRFRDAILSAPSGPLSDPKPHYFVQKEDEPVATCIHCRCIDQGDEFPNCPGDLCPDCNGEGTWYLMDHTGSEHPNPCVKCNETGFLRGPLSDEPRENENQDVAAPSVGGETNREWRDRNFPPQIIKAWLDGENVGTWQLVEQLKAWAHAWENESHGAAPSVGELEWHKHPDYAIGRWDAESGGGWGWTVWGHGQLAYGDRWIAQCKNVDAAKALAQRLQEVLGSR